MKIRAIIDYGLQKEIAEADIMINEKHGDKTSGLQFEGVPSERDLQAELTKLRNALDVAERALESYSDFDDYMGHDPIILCDRGASARIALTTIKQAKGEV